MLSRRMPCVGVDREEAGCSGKKETCSPGQDRDKPSRPGKRHALQACALCGCGRGGDVRVPLRACVLQCAVDHMRHSTAVHLPHMHSPCFWLLMHGPCFWLWAQLQWTIHASAKDGMGQECSRTTAQQRRVCVLLHVLWWVRPSIHVSWCTCLARAPKRRRATRHKQLAS